MAAKRALPFELPPSMAGPWRRSQDMRLGQLSDREAPERAELQAKAAVAPLPTKAAEERDR